MAMSGKIEAGPQQKSCVEEVLIIFERGRETRAGVIPKTWDFLKRMHSKKEKKSDVVIRV